MPETTPLIKAALNLRGGAGFDVYELDRYSFGLRQSADQIYSLVLSSLDGINWSKCYGGFLSNVSCAGSAEGFLLFNPQYYDIMTSFPIRSVYTGEVAYTVNISSAEMKDGDILKVSIDVENTGKRAGSEVVQLYVSDKDSTVPRAVKELKGFAKVFLNPGEKKTVTMELCARDFAYYETKIHDWYTPSGTYEIQIGHASDEIREAAELTFTTDVLLPFTVDMTTTMGELMNHPKTAGKMMEYLEGISQGEEPKKEDGEVQLVTPEIIAQMPLKTFLSVIPGEAIEQMIVELNALCQ